MDTKVIYAGNCYSKLPESYIRPESDRPNLSQVEDCVTVPVIDLGGRDRDLIIQQIACTLYGFSQVLNHGVRKEVAENMQKSANEFFSLPLQEKLKLYRDDPSKTMRPSTSFNVKKETIHNWRDYLRLHCYPLDQYDAEGPSNPSSFNSCILSKKIKSAAQILPTEVLIESLMGDALPQRNLVNGIDPDLPRLSGSPGGLESCTEHNDESLTYSNQIGGAIEAFSNTQLQRPRLSLQLPRFSNQGPAYTAVNGGELMTGGIQLYDGGVGHGDGIGNGFGANDREQSSASINGEHSTTYERASDYFRHVRTENGEVHFHMNSFVNVDGRVYNLMQERHLNNLGSSQLINKVMLAITGQTGIALMVTALNDRSSPFSPAFYVVVAGNTVGFITTMTSMLLRTRKPRASGVLAKVGAVAGSSAIILAMGMALHMRHIWAFLFLCIIAAAAVLFGQT